MANLSFWLSVAAEEERVAILESHSGIVPSKGETAGIKGTTAETKDVVGCFTDI